MAKPTKSASSTFISEILLQDQKGDTIAFKDYFRGHLSVVVFYYTRCENENNCSLTITKIAQLQKLLIEKNLGKKVKTAAISYDAIYDNPRRIKTYCEERQVVFNAFNKAFRVLDQLRSSDFFHHFKSRAQVQYDPNNSEEVDLYILYPNGEVLSSFQRSCWTPDDIISRLESHLIQLESTNLKSFSPAKLSLSAFHTLIPILIAFFPKCPLCWAGYLSLFGVASIGTIPYAPWLLPVLCAFLGINLWLIWKRSSKTERWFSFYLAILGAALLVAFGPLLKIDFMAKAGMILLVTGSLLNSLPGASKNWAYPLTKR